MTKAEEVVATVVAIVGTVFGAAFGYSAGEARGRCEGAGGLYSASGVALPDGRVTHCIRSAPAADTTRTGGVR